MKHDERRVAVTGLGCVTPLGNTLKEFWAALAAGRCGIDRISLLPQRDITFAFGAEVKGFDFQSRFSDHDRSVMDRVSMFAAAAADEAIADARLDLDAEDLGMCAVVIGSAVGGKTSDDECYRRLYGEGYDRVHPTAIPRIMLSAPASLVAMRHGITGETYAICSACASGAHAIAQGLRAIRSGRAHLAITGGTDAPFAFGLYKAWESLRVLSPEPCRPFSAERQGMTLGEGAAVLVLEEMGHAKARGATIHAELAGSGASADAHHLVIPQLRGPVTAIKKALGDAGIDASEIDYVNAHGTGTVANDVVETRALHAVFGEHAKHLAISSTKSMHGHSLGAASAVEAVATIKAIATETIPPTANYGTRDPDCDLDYVPNQARQAPIRAALSNAFGFGGLNCVLVFTRP
jgi:nodulation protein E